MRKPSRVVASRKVPVSASRGANATACTTMSMPPHWRLISSNAASVCSSTVTSSGITSGEPTDCASGTTRSFILSLTYEKASSAPSRCMAWAMPQAIERSVATPTIKARLPARKPMVVGLRLRIMPERDRRRTSPAEGRFSPGGSPGGCAASGQRAGGCPSSCRSTPSRSGTLHWNSRAIWATVSPSRTV